MRRNIIVMEYFETYYYANIVNNILCDTLPYLVNLNNWHENREGELFLTPFPKWSVLHDLAHFIIQDLLDEQIGDVTVDSVVHDRKSELWVDRALRYHGYKIQGFRAWLKEKNVRPRNVTEDHIDDYHNELIETGELLDLLEQLSNEVFFLLFGNRSLLLRLNNYISFSMKHIDDDCLPDEYKNFLEKRGVVKRFSIPEWVKRAVFFRDRGMCASCSKDISGLLTSQTDKHFDHIVPLAAGGINDVTNIQLLCEGCNLKKGRNFVGTSDLYESWY